MSRSPASPAYRAVVEALVSARASAGLTQVQLAERIGKPQSYISKIERHERRLDVVEFCAIAFAVGAQPSVVLGSIEPRLPRDLANEI